MSSSGDKKTTVVGVASNSEINLDKSCRQVVLDIETTGRRPEHGNRIIEIGAVEMIDRHLTGRCYWTYLDPECDIEPGALAVHGLTRQSLIGKPCFVEIADALLDFVAGAELVIHNAPFDMSFLDAEMGRIGRPRLTDQVSGIVDTLELAKELHPYQRNNLDALCLRYGVSSRHDPRCTFQDADLLGQVYSAMLDAETDIGRCAATTDKHLDLMTVKNIITSLGAQPCEHFDRVLELGEYHSASEEALLHLSQYCFSTIYLGLRELTPRQAALLNPSLTQTYILVFVELANIDHRTATALTEGGNFTLDFGNLKSIDTRTAKALSNVAPDISLYLTVNEISAPVVEALGGICELTIDLRSGHIDEETALAFNKNYGWGFVQINLVDQLKDPAHKILCSQREKPFRFIKHNEGNLACYYLRHADDEIHKRCVGGGLIID